jgi:hypothetical protein
MYLVALAACGSAQIDCTSTSRAAAPATKGVLKEVPVLQHKCRMDIT